MRYDDEAEQRTAERLSPSAGQAGFLVVTKSVSVTEFRRRPSAVWKYLETAGHVVFFTRRGKRVEAMTSVETYACLSGDYVKFAVENLVHAAVDESAAMEALEVFSEHWDKKYPKISASWRDDWPNLSTYFKYPQEVRRLIYTTNTIEGFNRRRATAFKKWYNGTV